MSMRKGTWGALLAASALAATLGNSSAVRAQIPGSGHPPGHAVEQPRQAPPPSRAAPPMQAPPPSHAAPPMHAPPPSRVAPSMPMPAQNHPAPSMPMPAQNHPAPNVPMPAQNHPAPNMPMPAQNHPAPNMQGAAPPTQQRAIGPHTPPVVGPRIMPAPHVPMPQTGAGGGAGANVAPPPQRGAEPAPHGPHPQPGVAPNAMAPQPGVAPQPRMAPHPTPAPAAGRNGVPWHGDIGRFQEHDVRVWRSGRWHHGPHSGRHGWWWVVGGAWYFYPTPVYPYPDPYVPGFVDAPPDDTDYWYYCPYWGQYYPYVATCPGGWQAVAAQP